ncbi:MAG: Asp-tRNA(Asn)/Glu-tRNA(Gln) amidotransferase subunit GatC [Tepidisphaera sp.]|jgi:aspartyl-tRNA(Asn)/glutamyl-tRNA(Gln) amidotransferase subunit C
MSDLKAQLTAAEVAKVAKLARLALSPAEMEAARVSMSAVLGYMDRLRELDLAGVEPLAHVSEGEGNRLRSDEPGQALPVETVKKLAPASIGPFISVPKVIGDGGGA